MFNRVSRERFNRRYKRQRVLSLVLLILMLIITIALFIVAVANKACSEETPKDLQRNKTKGQVAGPEYKYLDGGARFEGWVITNTGTYRIWQAKSHVLQNEWERRGGSPYIQKVCFVDYSRKEIFYTETTKDIFLDRIFKGAYITPFEKIMEVVLSYKNLRLERDADKVIIRNNPKITEERW